jgi:lipopolysaccharide/colanic/teichoic acid biosynthesis glycosyltransferase
VALLVLSPVLAACAIAVRLEGGPGILFRQERIGRDGVRFQLLKFRSMRPANEQESQTQWNIATDNRVGPVGRLLRITSLDELPQLFNILRGEMSFVGPRPLIETEDRQIEGRFRRRLSLTPGLTGLWQAHGRSDIPFEQMVNLDYLYVTNWSLWGDVKLVMRTVSAVVRGSGAY